MRICIHIGGFYAECAQRARLCALHDPPVILEWTAQTTWSVLCARARALSLSPATLALFLEAKTGKWG